MRNSHQYGTYLKNPVKWNDICTVKMIMGREENLGGNFAKNKITKEPRWFPLRPPVYDMERQLFSGVWMGAENKLICPGGGLRNF